MDVELCRHCGHEASSKSLSDFIYFVTTFDIQGTSTLLELGIQCQSKQASAIAFCEKQRKILGKMSQGVAFPCIGFNAQPSS